MLVSKEITDFLSKLQKTKTLHESWALFAQTVADFGLVEGQFLCLFQDGQGEHQDFISLSTYNEAFIKAYIEMEAHKYDYSCQLALRQTEPFIWDFEKYKHLISGKGMEVEYLSKDFKIDHGITIFTCGYGANVVGGVGLSATGCGRREFNRDILPVMHQVITMAALFDMHVSRLPLAQGLERPAASNMQGLKPLERETLKWLAGGYSTKVVAEKLHKSVESIDKYIHAAKKKLKARTRDQLVARAVILGLI